MQRSEGSPHTSPLTSCAPCRRTANTVTCHFATVTAALLLCAGCLTDSVELAQSTLTRLGIDPASFRDAPVCGEDGYQTYLVQLIDVTPGVDAGAVQLPTSGPVPCDSSVDLSFVTAGHTYEARLFLFEQAPGVLFSLPTEDESPIGTVLINEEGYPVEPRWLGECSEAVRQDPDDSIESDAGSALFSNALGGAVEASLKGTRRLVSCQVWPATGASE